MRGVENKEKNEVVKKKEKKTDFEKVFQHKIVLFCQNKNRNDKKSIHCPAKPKWELTAQPRLYLHRFCGGL